MRVRLHLKVLLMTVAGALSLLVATPAGAQSRTHAARTVPATAMLQPVDLAGVPTWPVTDDLWPWLRPPSPYGRMSGPGVRSADRAIRAVYPVGQNRPTVLLEYVAVYRGNGAERYFRWLRRTVSRPCTPCTGARRSWRLTDTGVAGRSSMLIRINQWVEYPDSGGRVQHTYVAVARVGHAIVVLADLGWEYGDGHPALVRGLAPVAVHRAASLR